MDLNIDTPKYGNWDNLEPSTDSQESKSRNLIDNMLVESGWTIIRQGKYIPEKGNFAVEELETDSGPMDYGLIIDGEVVGDVEAKSQMIGVPGILAQDERYSKNYKRGKFNFGGYRIPFLYSSNGHIIWYKDVRSNQNLEREVSRFHTPSALMEYLATEPQSSYKWLKKNPVDHPNIRPYQREAIEAIETAILGNKRKMIVAMATGSGKTFTAAELIYRLLKSRTAKRILFLVDRRSLAAQTIREFAAFEAEPAQKLDKLYEIYSQKFSREDLEDSGFDPSVLTDEYLTDPKSNHTFVYVSTIQRMIINLFGEEAISHHNDSEYEKDARKLDIPIHAFDIVIADECHRGYTSNEESKWREVLDHFDAIKIGLTATPAQHTTAYFTKLIYNYPVAKAIQENYLVDWDLVRINSSIRMKGLFLTEGEEVQLIDPDSGRRRYELLEDERKYEVGSLEKKATAPDSNKSIIEEYAKFARAFEAEYGRFPKTLVFAVNDNDHTSHADMLVEMLRQQFSERGSGFVTKITGKVDRPLQKIREFRNRPAEPAIVVTVDLLSTGVDIPTLEAILFIRPVKSRILFEQMMGRGTRLAKDIGKSHFTVYDAVGVVEYFKHATNFVNPLPSRHTKSFKQIINSIYHNKDRAYNTNILIRRFQRMSKDISLEGREKLEGFIEEGNLSKFAANLNDNLELNWTSTMQILRNPEFQEILENYPKIKNDFVVAIHQEDEVTSNVYPIVVNGVEYKPEDYLELFRSFLVKESDKIDALQILLKRPKELNTDILKELQTKLKESPGQFSMEHLRRAYRNNLADIIGMIKSAISNEPLLSVSERVTRAISTISKNRKVTNNEKMWLDLIANHLEYNLLIEKKHFDTIPFSGKGGWKKANQDFDNDLSSIMQKINEVMAQ